MLSEFFSGSLMLVLSALSIVGIMFSAQCWGIRPALVAVGLTGGVLAMIYYVTVPDIQTVGLSVFLLFSAALGSVLMGHRHAALLRLDIKLYHSRAIEYLYAGIIRNNDAKTLVALVTDSLSSILGTPILIIMKQAENGEVGDENNIHLLPVKHCMKEKQMAGTGTSSFADSAWRYVPMMVEGEYIGTLCIKLSPKTSDEAFQLIRRLAEIAAVAIKKALYGAEIESARVSMAVANERFQQFEKIEEVRTSQELEKMRSTLLSSIAHDLKTPLAAIIGSLSAIRHLGNTLKIHTQQDLIAMAQVEAERLNHFITNILELSKLEAGKLNLNLGWYDPVELMESLVKRMSFHQVMHRMHFVTSDPVCHFGFDVTLMEQVLQNIFDNCIKYTPPNSNITFRAKMLSRGGIITIADEGKGIASSKHAMVFNKFYRAHNEKEGTGLGLAICKAIIEAHGGTICVDINPEQKDPEYPGCLFTIYLPEACLKRTEPLRPVLYSKIAEKSEYAQEQ